MKQTLARWISIVAHPFIVGTAMIVATAFRLEARGQAMKIAAAFVVLAVVPIALMSWRQVRRGKWEHIDASNRRERPLLYAMGIGAAVLLYVYVLVAHPRSYLVRTIPITLVMFLVAAIAGRWVKISIHLMFAAMAATTLVIMRSPVGYVLVPVVPLLMWSRLVLARHTLLEVLLGALIGAATGYAFTL